MVGSCSSNMLRHILLNAVAIALGFFYFSGFSSSFPMIANTVFSLVLYFCTSHFYGLSMYIFALCTLFYCKGEINSP